MTISVLAKARKSDIRREPYAYLSIEDALEPDHFRALEETFPSVATVTGGAPLVNAKKGLNAGELLPRKDIAPVWKEFISYHTSPEFYREFLGLFGDEVRRLHPGLEKALGRRMEEFSTGLRVARDRRTTHRNDDFVLDCQVMYDDTRDARICRGPHVDDPAELYACLIYFRDPRDKTEGGNLYVARTKPAAEGRLFPDPNKIRVTWNPAEVDADDTEIVETIPYRRNSAVIFINSVRSLHAVTPRSASPIPRRHVNIIGETYALPNGLFQIDVVPGAQASGSALARVQRGLARAAGHIRQMTRQG
jgi:hypothetical protein